MSNFDDAIDAGDTVVEARNAWNEKFAGAKLEWDALVAKNIEIVGASAAIPFNIKALLKKYGPTLAALIGGPAVGIGATAVVADGGAFDGLLGALGSVMSILGIG